MTKYLLPLIPFLLGNSAGAMGAMVELFIIAAVGLAIIIGIIWGLIKWLS
jgi:hypothetical protein|tara:strand:- start:17129 stop:17278 length:150 start_codon:yes stop_codon:yes gene_type:complete